MAGKAGWCDLVRCICIWRHKFPQHALFLLSINICLLCVFQCSHMECTDQASHLWEPSFSSQCWTLPHSGVLEHKWQHLCYCWEVSDCSWHSATHEHTFNMIKKTSKQIYKMKMKAQKYLYHVYSRLLSFVIHSTFFGQWNIASLGAGPPQQEDQTYGVSDREAEADCEMFGGTRP